jgi:hypothetical protein
MIAKMLPAITADSPINLFFAFFETIRGAATNVPKKTLNIWIISNILILMSIQNMLISINIEAL